MKISRFYSLAIRRTLTTAMIANTLLGGCGMSGKAKKKAPKLSNDQVENVFVHGDPMELLKDSDTNDSSFFTVEKINDFKNFNFYGGASFYQKEKKEVERTTQESLEEDNKATSGTDATVVKNYRFVTEKSADSTRYSYEVEGDSKSLKLNFLPDQSGLLRLTEVEGIPVNPIHYSVNPAGDIFSILFSYEDPEFGTSLMVLFFTRNAAIPKIPEKVDPQYNFLLGPGIKAAWEGPITLDFCGQSRKEDRDQMVQATKQWMLLGKIGNREFSLKDQVKKAPFTDVNHHCILWVDNYLAENADDSVVYGMTLPIIDKTTQTIKSGSMIIFNQSFDKMKSFIKDVPEAYIDSEKKRTLAHEFGHFLGLHHEFDKDASGEPIDSIMGYNRNIRWVTPHDWKSVDHLYGHFEIGRSNLNPQ